MDWIKGNTARVCLGCGWFSYTPEEHDCDERHSPREVKNVTPENLKLWTEDCEARGFVEPI